MSPPTSPECRGTMFKERHCCDRTRCVRVLGPPEQHCRPAEIYHLTILGTEAQDALRAGPSPGWDFGELRTGEATAIRGLGTL